MGFPIDISVRIVAEWCDEDLGIPASGDPLEDRVLDAVVEAIEDALDYGEDNGFNHDLAGTLALEVNSVAAVGIARTPGGNAGAIRTALATFVDDVEDAGGCTRGSDGVPSPVGDPSWSNLGYAYLAACAALGRPPQIRDDDEETADVLD